MHFYFNKFYNNKFFFRIFLAKSNFDWSILSGLYSNCGYSDEMADAFYNIGSENLQNGSKDAQYLTTIKLAAWDQLFENSDSQISFPKK